MRKSYLLYSFILLGIINSAFLGKCNPYIIVSTNFGYGIRNSEKLVYAHQESSMSNISYPSGLGLGYNFHNESIDQFSKFQIFSIHRSNNNSLCNITLFMYQNLTDTPEYNTTTDWLLSGILLPMMNQSLMSILQFPLAIPLDMNFTQFCLCNLMDAYLMLENIGVESIFTQRLAFLSQLNKTITNNTESFTDITLTEKILTCNYTWFGNGISTMGGIDYRLNSTIHMFLNLTLNDKNIFTQNYLIMSFNTKMNATLPNSDFTWFNVTHNRFLSLVYDSNPTTNTTIHTHTYNTYAPIPFTNVYYLIAIIIGFTLIPTLIIAIRMRKPTL